MYKNIVILLYILLSFLPSALSVTDSAIINNSQKPSKYFEGRVLYLKQIKELLNKNKVLHISGLGGIGKTQIVRKYIQVSQNKYDIIWWFDCDNELNSQLVDLAEKINSIPHFNAKINTSGNIILHEIKDFFKSYNPKVLLVFDNFNKDNLYADQIYTLTDFKSTSLIFCSRYKISYNSFIDLERFTRKESIDFINKKLPNKPNSFLLAEILGDYPLALDQAIAFLLENPSVTVNEYAKLISTASDKVFKVIDSQYEDNLYKDTFAHTISLTFSRIKSNYPNSYKMLLYCKYLDNENIANDILQNTYIDSVPGYTVIKYLETLKPLIGYSIISVNDEFNDKKQKYFQMHKLVQVMLTEETIELSQDKKNIQHLLEVISNQIPEPGDASYLINYVQNNSVIIKNAEKVLEKSKAFEVITKEQFALAVKLLRVYMFNLQYEKSAKLVKYLEQMINNHNYQFVDNKSKMYLGTYYMLKAVLSDFAYSDYKISIHDLEKSRELLLKNPEGLSIQYVTLCQLAQTLLYSGDLSNAANYILEVEEILKKYSPKANTGLFYFIKAKLEMEQGNFNQALNTIKIGKSFTEQEFPNDNFTVIPDIVLLSEILVRLDKVQEAYNNLRGLYNDSFNYVDSDHELQARILITLANIENKLGKISDADTHISRAIKIEEHTSNADLNDDLASAYVVYADIIYNKGDFKLSKNYYEKALKIYNKRFEDRIEWDTLSELYTKLAMIALKLEDLYTATQYYELHNKYFGIKHPRTKEIYLEIQKQQIRM